MPTHEVQLGPQSGQGGVVAAGRLASYLRHGRRRGPGASAAGARGLAASAAQGWQKGLESTSEQYAFDLSEAEVEGKVPMDIAGTLYCGGPGNFEFGKNVVDTRKDGDGFVSAWTFAGDGSCKIRGRFVGTEGYLKEQKAVSLGYEGPHVYRSRLAAAPVLGQAAGLYQIDDVKPNANSGVAHFAGRLLAIDDCFLPVELDPAGLYTVGPTRLPKGKFPFTEDTLPKRGPFAIPKYDPAENRLVGLSCKTLARPTYNTRTILYEYDDKWVMANKRQVPFADYRRFPDFAFTRTDFVLAESPLDVQWLTYVAGGKTVSECVKYDKGGKSKFHLVPRKGGGEPVVVEGEADVIERLVNAYTDRESGDVVVDAISMSDLPTYDDTKPEEGPRTRLVRWTMKPDGSTGASRTELSSKELDYPTINPFVRSVKHGHVFSSLKVGGTPRGLHALDMAGGTESEWMADEGHFPAPPAFLCRLDGAAENDGYLASVVYDSSKHRSYLAILEAQNLSNGPVCKIWLKSHIPHGSLPTWADGYVPSKQDYSEGRRKALWSDKGWEEFDSQIPFI